MDEKLKLRALSKHDLPMLKEIRDYCLDFLDTPISYTLAETMEWYHNTKPEWVVIEVHDKMAGYIRVSDYDKINSTMYIGADIHPNFRGYGYAFQGYQKAIEHFKLSHNIRRFYLKVRVSNFRAYNLYTKLGFNSIGIIPDALKIKTGMVDQILMYKNI
jgi:RimJ/RimL family protein N-acetyltransferase